MLYPISIGKTGCKNILARPPSLQTDICGHSAMPNYTLPFEKRGSVVDSWVRGGTRAVPSQCSGPPVTFSAGPGFGPGTYAVIPHVPNHLATWAGHESWWKNIPLISTHILHHYKKWPRRGSNHGPHNPLCVLIHQTTPNTWWTSLTLYIRWKPSVYS